MATGAETRRNCELTACPRSRRRALPDLPIVLNHLGGVIVFCDDAPLLIGQEPIPILPPVATIPCSP
jgi:hypothetical protein